MHDPMLELLFSEYRRKVLSLLFIEPGRVFHVREIARRTATQAGTLHKELSRLAEGAFCSGSGRATKFAIRPTLIA